MAGYNEMLRRIELKKIISNNTPFSEMQGKKSMWITNATPDGI